MNKLLMAILLVSSKLWAVQCYFTVAKGGCWKDYDVDVVLVNRAKQENVQTIHIPKGQLYTRVNVECQSKDVFSAFAQFSPAVFEEEENNKYPGVRFWAMPLTAPKPGGVWEIDICYPLQFAKLPMPKTDNSDCKCDFSSIPALENPNVITDTNS